MLIFKQGLALIELSTTGPWWVVTFLKKLLELRQSRKLVLMKMQVMTRNYHYHITA